MPGKGSIGQTFAIIIGISKYRNLSSLQFADKDAIAFADYLLSKDGWNVEPDHVKVFLNEDATSDSIVFYMQYLLMHVKPKKEDWLIIYFAGHGNPE